jgi:hypothetical protein
MTATDLSVRPFEVRVPEEDLADLRRRLAATRWPGTELVADRSQGVQLATIQALVTYWGTGYDWRTCEARLNALPQFVTEIDGLGTEHKVGDPAFCRTGTRLRSVVSAGDRVATRIPLRYARVLHWPDTGGLPARTACSAHERAVSPEGQ